MWAVSNRTPYAAERSWVQDKDGNKLWIVVVKATFDVLDHGKTRLAEKQLPVFLMPEYLGDVGQSSLVYDADLLGVKTKTDVLVRGSAWAPKGKSARSVDVEIKVGEIQKSLRVFGDRVWDTRLIRGVTLSEPKPFETIPIEFERAYGGWDSMSSNPHRAQAGCSQSRWNRVCDACRTLCWDARAEHRIPESPDQFGTDRPQPAGFGAVACELAPRRELAGTYDGQWRMNRFPLWAEDFNPRYNNCAPEDQQAREFFRGGEAVELLNLSPAGQLSFRLPRVYPHFRTRFGREIVEHRARLVTVILEPDVSRVVMAWQTSLMCNRRADELDETVVAEKQAV